MNSLIKQIIRNLREFPIKVLSWLESNKQLLQNHVTINEEDQRRKDLFLEVMQQKRTLNHYTHYLYLIENHITTFIEAYVLSRNDSIVIIVE